MQAAIEAVAEVGNPTIVATLTVVAALLPMLFVSGLMGPYMAPIPANASAAMLFSFFVAMVIAPWLMLAVRAARRGAAARARTRTARAALGRALSPLCHADRRARRRARLDVPDRASASRRLLSLALFATKAVTVKLLPFDNKSEMQVVVDLPEGASAGGHRARAVRRSPTSRADLPEIARSQTYAGTPAPFNFNGLVRHYYLRASPELGERAGQPRAEGRARAGPATTSRSTCASGSKALDASRRHGASRWSRCRPDRRCWRRCSPRSTAPTRRRAAPSPARCKKIFRAGALHRRRRRFDRPAAAARCGSRIDQDRLEYFGVEQRDVYDTIAGAVRRQDRRLFAPRRGRAVRSRSRVRLPKRDLALRARRWPRRRCRPTRCPASKTVVELGDVVQRRRGAGLAPRSSAATAAPPRW